MLVSLSRPVAFTVLLSWTALGGGAAWADEPSLPAADWAERYRWGGEELYYSIEILEAEAARCAIALGHPIETEEWGIAVPMEGLAMSVGLFGAVYSMHDTATTYVSPTTGLPLSATKEIDERGLWRQYEVTYDREHFHTDVARTREGRTDRSRRYTPSDIHDAISWMVDLRSRDLSVGREYVYHVFDGWKLSRLTGRVIGHTDVYTELGMIEVAEIEFEREVLASHHPTPYADEIVDLPPVYIVSGEPERLGVGWFSLDERRLPVGVEIESPIGHLRMILDRWEPPSP